jgi:hypothetical protein
VRLVPVWQVVPVAPLRFADGRMLRTYADWLLHHVPRPELWLRPGDGHISILDACPVAMDWRTAFAAARAGNR